MHGQKNIKIYSYVIDYIPTYYFNRTALLTTRPTLKISGVIPLLLLYAFMAWAGTNLPFLLLWRNECELDGQFVSVANGHFTD